MILLQSCIAAKRKVNWVYAIMRDRDVATNYGFSMQLPGVARWATPVPEGRCGIEWLVALSADHLAHMMKHHARSFENL